jgi:hypothetical protein
MTGMFKVLGQAFERSGYLRNAKVSALRGTVDLHQLKAVDNDQSQALFHLQATGLGPEPQGGVV